MSESCQRAGSPPAKLLNMTLDHDLCYAASKSRDPRFDGRFFVAVLTTHIYCRPICPVVMPKRENVRFYATAAAARNAGFRPCLRCRPEASPGTPDWQGPSALVARGLHLIDQGVVDQYGVDGLSDQLNVGTRQLRRLFLEHLGASPLRVAQTRRLHFAKRLIDETSMTMSAVAFAAGFSSIRRFNDALRSTYNRTPTELRNLRNRRRTDQIDGCLTLTLSYRPPFDWSSLLEFLRVRTIPGVERVEAGTYQRTVRLGDEQGLISVCHSESDNRLLLSLPPNLTAHVLQISERVRNLFDLRADPMAIAEHLRSDPELRPLVDTSPGLRVPGSWSAFELGVRAILGQQISVRAANTLAGRLVDKYGGRLHESAAAAPDRLFPTAGQLAMAPLEEIGLPSRRAETIREYARAVGDNRLWLKTSVDLETAIRQLTGISGIGSWTAHYVAMRGLGEPDAFPAGDLALRRTIQNGRQPQSESSLMARSQVWRPWRAYAAMHLWKRYADGVVRP